jgi:hypothetical protein
MAAEGSSLVLSCHRSAWKGDELEVGDSRVFWRRWGAK